jgi:hypothetical protein
MAEHWSYDFFKLAEPKEVDRDGVTLASTTDSQESLDAAAEGHYVRVTDGDLIYTETTAAEAQTDGTIEHNPIRRLVNGRKPKENDSGLTDHFAGMSDQQRMANRTNYRSQAAEAAAIIPDFEKTAYDERVELPGEALEMIADGGLPNAAYIQHYLSQHKEVASEMIGKTRKQVQARMKEISAQLATNAVDMAIDRVDFANYRRLRNKQVRERYR